jgi:hypothetical protein
MKRAAKKRKKKKSDDNLIEEFLNINKNKKIRIQSGERQCGGVWDYSRQQEEGGIPTWMMDTIKPEGETRDGEHRPIRTLYRQMVPPLENYA